MNVTFRLPSEELEAKFAKEALEHGLGGVKGHRSVGGMRTSIYNAMPMEGCQAHCLTLWKNSAKLINKFNKKDIFICY